MGRRKKDGVDMRLEIICLATKWFLERGYNHVSAQMIAKELGISVGTLAYHFPAKEDMLKELVSSMADFQWRMISEPGVFNASPLFSYALEIAMQTAMCEDNASAKDLYVSAYTSLSTLALIKEWASQKAAGLFADRLPHWTPEKFRVVENFTSAIELGALMEPCSDTFTLDDKVTTALDILMGIYEVPKTERDAVIQEIICFDYRRIGNQTLENFIIYINETNQKAIDEVKKAFADKEEKNGSRF